jgi:membrane-bound serine protease (ClpP class)
MSTLGLVLLVLGAILAVAEAHVVSHGVIGTAAVAALAVGAALVVAGAGAELVIGLGAGLAIAAVGGGCLAFVVGRGLAARRMPVRGGAAGVQGRVGELVALPAPVGKVRVDGALWRARLSVLEDGAAELRPGDAVVVERVHGLTLTVRRAEEWEVAP